MICDFFILDRFKKLLSLLLNAADIGSSVIVFTSFARVVGEQPLIDCPLHFIAYDTPSTGALKNTLDEIKP